MWHFLILISVHEEILVRARDRLAAEPAIMRKRTGLVEHPFGTIKDRHGRSGLLCRGLALAGAEMGLSAWAYNFTRVLNLVGPDGPVRRDPVANGTRGLLNGGLEPLHSSTNHRSSRH
jgi:hypothetical protein